MRVVFIETGTTKAGLMHIESHLTQFLSKGITRDKIPDVVMDALRENRIVGYQGAGKGRPIYSIVREGKEIRIAITTGDNGFIVGANPK